MRTKTPVYNCCFVRSGLCHNFFLTSTLIVLDEMLARNGWDISRVVDDIQPRGGTTWTGDFKRREVKTGFCRSRSMQTRSSGTLTGWKSSQTTFVPLWDRMEGAWLRTLVRASDYQSKRCNSPEPVYVNLLRSPGIDSQPGGIDSWAP
jgi:hypothetical protein